MRKRLILMAAVFLPMLFMVGMYASLAIADDGIWYPLSQAYFMSQIKGIDIGYDNFNQKYIFAAEGAANGKIWISENNGLSWLQSTAGVLGHGFCKVFVQKDNFEYAWALVQPNDRFDIMAGPYFYNKTTNQWSQRISGIGNTSMWLFCMAVDQNSDYFGTALVGGGDAEGSGAFLYRTTNATDWSQPNWIDCDGVPIPPSIMPNNFIQDIAFAPSDPLIAYFIMNSDENVPNFRGLFKSTDRGLTWSCANFWGVYLNDMDSDFYFPYALAVDPNDANRVAVSVCCGAPEGHWIPGQRIARILISTEINGDREWVQLYQHPSDDHVCNSLAFSSDGSSLYAAFESKLNQFNRPEESFVVRIDGIIPHQLPSGEQPGDKRSLCVALDPLNDANVYVGTEHIVYSSQNYGDDFQSTVNEANIVAAIKRIDAEMPNLYFMADNPPIGSIYRSTDDGQNWILRRDGWSIINSTCIQNDPGDPGLMLAACTNNVLEPNIFSSIQKSTDFGETWSVPAGWFIIEDPGFFIPGLYGTINCIAIDTSQDPSFHDYVYFGISGADPSLYYSGMNGGYPQPNNNYAPPNANPLDIAIHPTNSMTMIIADGSNGLYRTTDHGVNFSPINGQDPDPVITSASKFKYCPGHPTMALVATPDGIYKSNDVDLSSPHWTETNPENFGGPVIDMDFHPTDNSIVCFCAAGVNSTIFYISADSTRSWLSFNLGYDGHNFSDLSIDVNNPDAFYAATDAGIYKLKNPVKSGLLPLEPVDQYWGPGTVIVNGDVTVPYGITLHIESGTTVKFVYNFDKEQAGASASKSELIVIGSLKAYGTQEERIVFESSSPADGNWYGIACETNGSLEMQYCTVRDAVYGVNGYKPYYLTIDNCLFERISTAGVYITGNANPVTPLIQNSQFNSCGTYGIRCSQYPLNVQQCTITESAYGVYYEGNNAITVSDCDITHSLGGTTYYGIRASKSTTSVVPLISGTYIYGFAQGGIYISGGSNQGLISNTEIARCGNGVFYSSSSTPIVSPIDTKNLFRENTNGLWLASSSSPMIRRTKFYNNVSRGVYVSSGCQPDIRGISTSEANSFIYSGFTAYYDLYNANILPIYATNNFWGEPVPIASQIFNATYIPYLVVDPLPRRSAPYDPAALSEDFELSSVYPNPFNPSATISFNLTRPQQVSVRVYNIMGQAVAMVFDGIGRAGENVFVWDGRNLTGQQVAAGVYFCQLRTAESQQTLKMTVLK